MAWDDPTSKTKLESGPVNISDWTGQVVTALNYSAAASDWQGNSWQAQLVSSILNAWAGTFEWMIPISSGGSAETYNTGFNNGLVIGLRIRKR